MHSSPSPGEKGSLATAPHSAKCTDRAATAPHSLHWVTSASASLGFATNVTPEEQQLQTVCCFPEVATKLSASCPGSIHAICHVCTGDVFTHKRTHKRNCCFQRNLNPITQKTSHHFGFPKTLSPKDHLKGTPQKNEKQG